MHFAFVVKCEKNGRIDFYPWQVHAATVKDAEKKVVESFERDDLANPGCRGKIVEIAPTGECDDGIGNSDTLYEKACKRAEKMKLREQG